VKFNKTIIAILMIGILEAIALLKGVNGVAFASSMAVIAGLGGFAIGKIKPEGKE